MAIRIALKTSSGRATCRICKEPIRPEELQVTASGYRDSGSVHLKCLVKNGAFPDQAKDSLVSQIKRTEFNLQRGLDKTVKSIV